ncbi:CE1759 family FMN reductase [Streptomyces sp. GESEQ-35]|uniref:CE1759 family FMN reductase n=1 Tax=Streptomyces sp. GESEQ-35 TaxID=2812657 RepID=UPI001B33C27D|nr:CE1759 family FMN reductase [Streptomyces sp. GESEQ-35]
MNNPPVAPQQVLTITVVNAGVSDPSSTRLLADRIAQKSIDALRDIGMAATVRSIDLGPLAVEIARSIVSGMPDSKVQDAIAQLAESDAVIAAAPVYKAGISGLFKSFADLIDNDLLIAKPVILAATGGSARHSMVVDDHLRPLFAFLRAIPMPTSLYAVPEDWGSTDLGKRIARAAGELAAVLRSGVGRDIADGNWAGYQHAFGGNATRAEHSIEDIDFDTDLMRLATGGTARPPVGDRADVR